MSSDHDELVVVAKLGYQVLLNVGRDCLVIDSFSPVNLNQLYDAETLNACGSLAAHLREGNLVKFEGQKLPEDPNTQKIEGLRQSEARHREAGYKQQPRNPVHANFEVETVADTVNPGDDLQQQVAQSRKEIQDDSRIKTTISKGYTQSPAVDSGDALNALQEEEELAPSKLRLKVSMDVSGDEFTQRQEASRIARAKQDEQFENTAAEEIEEIDNNQSESSGGQ